MKLKKRSKTGLYGKRGALLDTTPKKKIESKMEVKKAPRKRRSKKVKEEENV